jgi:hypothetical protein
MKKGMMYREFYTGKYYKAHIVYGDDVEINNDNISGLKIEEVPFDKLVEDDLYLNENGSTIRYMGSTSHEVISRSPLYATEKLENLSSDNQLRMFWTLKRNCKHGTANGM